MNTIKMKTEVANCLTTVQLKNLFNNNTLLLRLPEFFDPFSCATLSQKIHQRMPLGFYENAPKIGRIGKAFYETISNPDSHDEYFQNSSQWIENLRKCCFPYISPIDALRVMLDDLWPKGSTVASLDGRRMFVGLARYFTSESSAEPHQDIIQRDAPGTDLSAKVQRQIAFNVYLTTPEYGGEIEIWDWIATQEDFYRFKDSRTDFAYAFDRTLIPEADLLIKPNTGDLILFNSNNVHAVTPSSDDRLSISCFIGYCGDDSPLVLWS
ncbi:2OG-Fe(II) oxygenase [Endozoicomonas gorgoniicola]|uniref:2OG-Fe(II) oxygenase n=1 Tax=Endozoicomonas gorgoniicola TaxID=1234144 RepID=A0ABT3MUJ0_9GAMM|nr:2OG-Fe(II) oxygenase [Endozoicomonas gorgoniicola]MCW7552644.1 2OG-Fe(II) oxygenase [Endozoicomonas gorgoniicola]